MTDNFDANHNDVILKLLQQKRDIIDLSKIIVFPTRSELRDAFLECARSLEQRADEISPMTRRGKKKISELKTLAANTTACGHELFYADFQEALQREQIAFLDFVLNGDSVLWASALRVTLTTDSKHDILWSEVYRHLPEKYAGLSPHTQAVIGNVFGELPRLQRARLASSKTRFASKPA